MRTVRWTFVQGYLIFEGNRQIVDKERKWERVTNKKIWIGRLKKVQKQGYDLAKAKLNAKFYRAIENKNTENIQTIFFHSEFLFNSVST